MLRVVALFTLFTLSTFTLSARAFASDDAGPPDDAGALDGAAADSAVMDTGAPDSAIADSGAGDAAFDAGPITLLGDECTSSSQCVSGFCVDGLCCDTACTGQCEACDDTAVSGTPGLCIPIAGAPHGARPACSTGSASEPCQAATCDGLSAQSCDAYAPETTSCGEPICVGGLATPGGFCDGHGQCDSLTGVTCGAYACGAYQCNTSCTTDADCAAAYKCQGSTCVIPGCDDAGNGAACSGAPPNGASGGGSSGGCAMSAPTRLGGGVGALFAIGAACIALVRRRRRARV